MIDYQTMELIGYILALGGLWAGVLIAVRVSSRTRTLATTVRDSE